VNGKGWRIGGLIGGAGGTALLVRGFEGFGDLSRDRQRFVEGNGTARGPLRKGRTLIATSRFNFASRARYTSPIPPMPRVDRIS